MLITCFSLVKSLNFYGIQSLVGLGLVGCFRTIFMEFSPMGDAICSPLSSRSNSFRLEENGSRRRYFKIVAATTDT